MKIGYNQANGKNCSTLETDLALCERVGFDYIEIRLDMLHSYLKNHSMASLCDFFAASRIKPHALNAIYCYDSLFLRQDQAQSDFMEEFEFASQAAAQMGAMYIIVVPPINLDRVTPYAGSRSEIQDRCVAIMSRLGEVASEYGVKLCFELVGASCCSVRSISCAKDIVEAVDRENVGYVFDTYNIFLGDRQEQYSRMTEVEPSKIFAVHINDCDDIPVTEMGQDKRCFCGHGVLDLAGYLRALKKTGYDGMVSIETFRPGYWEKTPQWIVENAYSTTLRVLRENNCL
ncbi:inosose isomerase [Synergistales bacterium]|nr:inosose isomerase [Synergistales bacterium]